MSDKKPTQNGIHPKRGGMLSPEVDIKSAKEFVSPSEPAKVEQNDRKNDAPACKKQAAVTPETITKDNK